jgi:vitamin B12 transporter
VQLAIYHTHTTDLIQFDTSTNRPENIASATIFGGELAAITRLADWRVELNVDASRPTDDSTDERLLRRAPYRATLALAREFGPLDVGAAVTHVASRYDTDINTFERVGLGAYTLVRATLSYRIGDRVRLTLRGENLANAHYQLVSGYNTQRRGAFIGAEVRI